MSTTRTTIDENMIFSNLPDLAAERIGGELLYVTNEAFAPARNLIQPGRGIFIEEKFTVVGKWMDGWETDRHAHLKRNGTDYVIIKLASSCHIYGLDIDTNHFTGNYCEEAKVEAIYIENNNTPWHIIDKSDQWETILPKTIDIELGDLLCIH